MTGPKLLNMHHTMKREAPEDAMLQGVTYDLQPEQPDEVCVHIFRFSFEIC